MAGTLNPTSPQQWKFDYPPEMWAMLGVPQGTPQLTPGGTSALGKGLAQWGQQYGGGAPNMQMPGQQDPYGFYGKIPQPSYFDPGMFNQLAVPSYLQGQQAQARVGAWKSGSDLAQTLARQFGLESPEGYAGRAAQLTSVASEPIVQNFENSLRAIENRYARSGTSLSSEYGRDIGEAQGALSSSLRNIGVQAQAEGEKERLAALLRLFAIYS